MSAPTQPSSGAPDGPSPDQVVAIAANLRAVRARVASACERVGRDPASVAIVAVTKRHPVAVLLVAAAAGIVDIGENYAQEMRDKRAELGAAARRFTWHFIGQLQRNKVKYVAGNAALIHAVDSVAIAEDIVRHAERQKIVQRVLLAVNTGGEAAKSGVAPDQAGAVLDALHALPGIVVAGLMTMPPFAEVAEDNRVYFRILAGLRRELASPTRPLSELSMGTTDDFEVAVEEGATLIRVGTALFGSRPT